MPPAGRPTTSNCWKLPTSLPDLLVQPPQGPRADHPRLGPVRSELTTWRRVTSRRSSRRSADLAWVPTGVSSCARCVLLQCCVCGGPQLQRPHSMSSMETLLVGCRSSDAAIIPIPYCWTGYFAVKKVAVGQSHSYLLNTIREVCQAMYDTRVVGSLSTCIPRRSDC